MSRKPKNNHYHYAEQFTDRARQARRRGYVLPKRFIFLALVLVVMFAVITTTFSANMDTESESSGGLIVRVRNNKVAQDYVAEGMDREEAMALTGADADLASTAGYTDLLYNSDTKGWGTNSTTACNSAGWFSLRFTAATNNESFKIYHKNWGDAYFSKSAAAVSLNTQYTLNNTGSNPNLTFSFVQNAYYGMKIENPDAYNNMKMTLYRLFDANAVFYIDVSSIWGADDPEIGGYFCDSTTNTAEWVRATRCADISNSHLYRLVAPNSNIYSKLVLGRFKKGTTASQMSFSGDRFYNQSVDILYLASNTKIKMETWQTNNDGKSTISTSSITHTHKYYAYEYTRTSTSGSYSLARTIASNTSVACGTSTVSLSASDRSSSGYDFDGWYRGTTSGVNNATTKVSSNRSCTVTNYSGTSYYYAKYTLSSFTITYKSDATPATAAANTIINPSAPNTVPTSEEKTYGVDYTITSKTFDRSSYTQKGWATAANHTSQSTSGGTTYYALGANYTGNANLTLYPVWQLKAPTRSNTSNLAPSIVTAGSMTVGSTPVDLGLTVSDQSDDVYRSYDYSISASGGATAANASVCLDPEDDDFMLFTASEPGTYTVTITVKDYSKTGVINAFDQNITDTTDPRYHKGYAYSTTNQATITVSPEVPTFTITAYNIVNDGERDGTTAETAYKILLGNRYHFSAEVDSAFLNASSHANYSYIWSTNADFAAAHILNEYDNDNNCYFSMDHITFTNEVVPNTNPKEYDVNLITYPTLNPSDDDPRTLANESHGLEQVVLYCRAVCNGASKDSDDRHLFYFIQPLIESFKYEPKQKIYNINDQTVSLAAEYNISNDPTYTTKLYFSHDNYNTTLAQQAQGFIESFVTAIKAYLYPSGPKYFYMEITGYNSMNELITSVSDKIHTTVGTADSTTLRALYFSNNTGVDLKNYLVMCYYLDGSGNLRYQTAQDMNKGDENNEGLDYRIMLPADATAVRFGFLARDVDRVRYYGYPTVSSGTIGGFATPNYFGYTDQIALSSAVTKISADSVAVSSGLQVFTCSAGAY